MTTFLVSPPSCNEQFEVEAKDHLYDNDQNTIIFRDKDDVVVATYVANPGTVICEKTNQKSA
jgi:hypothetical protein